MKKSSILVGIIFGLLVGCAVPPKQPAIQQIDLGTIKGNNIAVLGSFFARPSAGVNLDIPEWELDNLLSKNFADSLISFYSNLDIVPYEPVEKEMLSQSDHDSTKTMHQVIVEEALTSSILWDKGYRYPRGDIHNPGDTLKVFTQLSAQTGADLFIVALYFPVIHSSTVGGIVSNTGFNISVVGTLILIDKSGRQLLANSIYATSNTGTRAGILGLETQDKYLLSMLSYNFKPIMYNSINTYLIETMKPIYGINCQMLLNQENTPPFILPSDHGKHIQVYWSPLVGKGHNSFGKHKLIVFDDNFKPLKTFIWNRQTKNFAVGSIWDDLGIENKSLNFVIYDADKNKSPIYSLEQHKW